MKMNSFKNLVRMMTKTPALISTRGESMEVTEDQLAGPPWPDLPPHVIEKIYSFLNRRDQRSMSLVCRNWRKDYSFPSLWRRVEFCFPDPENNSELCPNVIFAWNYGTMFHQVRIVFKMVGLLRFLPLPSATNFRQLKFFMHGLIRHSQLLSISFEFCICNLRTIDAAVLDDLYHTILILLNSQNKLQYVRFDYPEFKAAEAAEILKVLFVNNSKTLRYLYLPGLFNERPDDDYTVDNDLNFVVLMHLEVLEMDYTQMFVKMMLSFYECRNRMALGSKKGRLKKINLFCNGYRIVNYGKIDPLVWQYFKKMFPDLTVKVLIVSSCDLFSISMFIVPRMPVRALTVSSIYRPGFVQQTEIGSLLSYIASCGINKSIEKLRIIWKASSSNLSTGLISFTKMCPLLKIVELEIEHPVPALDTVFKSWTENRPASLQVVLIAISSVQATGEREIYTRLNDTYAPLLRSSGLNLSLVI